MLLGTVLAAVSAVEREPPDGVILPMNAVSEVVVPGQGFSRLSQ